MERFAGGRNVMLATGGQPEPPSSRNPRVQWIFSTSLTEKELNETARPRKITDGQSHARLIIACRQDEAKGTGRVIAALPLIMRRFPDATLDVVGDGPDLPRFRALAAEAGVAGHVRFHGKFGHQRVLELLGQAEMFCYPTAASEGFPKAVLEALACGLPVVTTPVSVLQPLIAGGGGVLLDNTTPECIAQAVVRCFGSPDSYRAMSERAIETARSYSLESWGDSIRRTLEAAWGPPCRTNSISAA
jgi:glycosyltransferase involved in cell wall biosynthesis